MKFSIRFRILTGVVLVNLIGILVVMVYLHQSYSGNVAVTATKQVLMNARLWDGMQKLGGDEIGSPKDPKAAAAYVEQLKAITGNEYAMLIDKQALDPAAYAKAREAAGLPDNYAEGATYVQVALTKEEWAKEFEFKPAPDSVPEVGKLVGVKNGACSKMCHNSMKAQGDYWGVAWSDEAGVSEAHGVSPISVDGKPIGVLYTIENVSDQANVARASMIRTFIVIAITLIIATLAIGAMVDIWIFRRLRAMTVAMEDISMRVAGGDFDARYEPDGTQDEIGHFEEFFARFMDLISATLKSLIS